MASKELRLQILLDALDKASGPLDAIRGEARKAGAAVGEARSELKKLDRAQADIRGFRDLKRGLQETELKLDSARKRAAALAREINATEKPTRKLSREFERAKRQAADLGGAFEQQQRKLHDTGKRLREAGHSTSDLKLEERRLAAAVKSTNAELDRRKQRFADLKRTQPARLEEARISAHAADQRAERWNNAARYGTGIVGAAVGVAATASGVDAVVEAAQYEELLTSVGQKANFTREQAQRLGDTLSRIAPSVGRMPQEMAQASDTLAGIGLLNQYEGIADPEQRFRAIEKATVNITRAAGKAATAYKAEQDEMVRSIAAGVQNLHIPAEKAQRIMDMMAAGDNAGALGMKAMSEEFPALTGAWGALGQTGEKALGQLIAGLETARMLAGDDAEAANNLRNLILKLNAQETQKNFAKFGIDLPAALKRAKAEGRDLLEVIAELTLQATNGDTDKIGHLFGDQQAQMAITALIGKLKEYRAIRDSVMDSEGTVDRQFEERMQDQVTKVDRLKAKWSELGIAVGNSLKPMTDYLIDGATNLVDKLTANVRARGMSETIGALVTGGTLYTPAQAQKLEATAAAFGGQLRQKMAPVSASEAMGRMMMDGLSSGLMASAPSVMATVTLLGNRIKAVFQKSMDIHSPSRVFERYGHFMTEGLAQGIAGGGGAPLAAMGKLSNSLTPSQRGNARPAAAAAAAPAANITFNVYQRPGEDGEALAQRVAALIDRRKANGRRGGYADA